jgi:hypothetical protein
MFYWSMKAVYVQWSVSTSVALAGLCTQKLIESKWRLANFLCLFDHPAVQVDSHLKLKI